MVNAQPIRAKLIFSFQNLVCLISLMIDLASAGAGVLHLISWSDFLFLYFVFLFVLCCFEFRTVCQNAKGKDI